MGKHTLAGADRPRWEGPALCAGSLEAPDEIWTLTEAVCSVGSVAQVGFGVVSPCFLTVGNLFHFPPPVFLEVVVTSSFNVVIITQEILVPGVMGLRCARGFGLMSLALWFTPVFSQLWVVPHLGAVSISRVSRVLLETHGFACFWLREGGGEK